MKVSTNRIKNIARLTIHPENRRFLLLMVGSLICLYLAASGPCGKYLSYDQFGRQWTNCIFESIRLLINYGHKVFYRLGPEEVTNHILIHSNTPSFSRKDRRKGITAKSFKSKEYGDPCSGILALWSAYPMNEVQGYITLDSKMIITAIGSIWEVTGPRPIFYRDRYYFPWDKRQHLNESYEGTIDYPVSRHIFIPVRAMFHTHVLYGYGKLSDEDLMNARDMRQMTHLLLERGRISAFDEEGITKVFNTDKAHACPDIVYNSLK